MKSIQQFKMLCNWYSVFSVRFKNSDIDAISKFYNLKFKIEAKRV